jgi:hypothetical protein
VPGLLAMLAYVGAVIADTKDPDTWDMNRRSDLKPIRPILEALTTAAKALSKVEA